MPQKRPHAITKVLSRNDTGETGGHQAGILVPKDPDILAFFPSLDRRQKNPRHHLHFTDELGETWLFAFIYYNNALFGGTRNEYRLTRMTPFIRAHSLHVGDKITLHRNANADYTVSCQRKRAQKRDTGGKLRLGSTWKIVSI